MTRKTTFLCPQLEILDKSKIFLKKYNAPKQKKIEYN